ncbi:MAG TPA: sigma-70 family RNA polymerase sigma factor [Ktedonobacterales bacterium]|nr:sigma-70 family RNA polymerase sigma factor [Ktedonobacterales bacterium]
MSGNRGMDEHEWLAEQFEHERPRLRAVAYRLLGSLSEADDAVQESWLHVSRSDSGSVTHLGRWLTTVVARVCLDMLRSRAARREDLLEGHLPDPIISREEGMDPEQEVLLAESVGLALQVVLETLEPAERVTFVLHDVFAVPFDEIAPLVGRSPVAARQLASRARRRVQGAAPVPDADLAHSRTVVDAFFAALREGDFEALLAVLDPDVLVRADSGARPPGVPREVRGARAVAEGARAFARNSQFAKPVLVNGTVGVVAAPGGQPYAVLGFTVRQGKIVEIDILLDPTRLRQLDLSALDE